MKQGSDFVTKRTEPHERHQEVAFRPLSELGNLFLSSFATKSSEASSPYFVVTVHSLSSVILKKKSKLRTK